MASEEAQHGSVTVWLERLKAGDQRDAVARLWASYFKRMVALARDHLRARVGDRDGEDVALSAFDTFVRAAQGGRFPQLNDRHDLWQILLMLTARKTSDAMAKSRTLKAGGGRLVRLSELRPGSDDGAVLFDPPGGDPDPAEVVVLAEGLREMLAALGTGDLRQVAVLRMEGFTNEEVAAKLGRSVATVERKLKAARSVLAAAGFRE